MGKRIYIIFFATIFYVANVLAGTSAIITVPVADMYKKPGNNVAVISQAIYDTNVEVLDSARNGWVLIRTPDNYQGWVKSHDLVSGSTNKTKHILKVENLFANIYTEPDTTQHKPLLVVPFATQLPIKQFYNDRWIKIQLADGNLGWIQSGDVAIDPKPLTMQQMLELSHKFVGLPYTWGGVSTYGFDCSGFVQMLYEQMGILIPRDAGKQLKWAYLIKVTKPNLEPGDILYFGFNGKVSHEAVYLGNGLIIHDTAYKNPIVQVSHLNDPYWQSIYITARRLNLSIDPFASSIKPLPIAVKHQMQKYTWHKGCPVDLSDLVYLQLSYWGFDNKTHQGVLIVNKYLAPEIANIFQELYQQKFPIEKMRPMYVYKGDDNASMLDDNTSAFNCRMQTDFPNLFSIHSYGGAIDINPLINPYVNGNKVEPPQSKKYLKISHKGKINNNVVKIFNKYGWVWGGSWTGKIHDYQHFEKPTTD
jgi:cell wall-associated NlpC family hydrolase